MVWTIKPHHLQKNVPLYAQTTLNVAQQNIQPPQKYANFIKNVFQAILNLKTIFFTRKVLFGQLLSIFCSRLFRDIFVNCKEKTPTYCFCFCLQSLASKMDNILVMNFLYWKKFPLLMLVKKNVRNLNIVNFGPLITTTIMAIVIVMLSLILLQILKPVNQHLCA